RQRKTDDPNRAVLMIAIGRQYVEQDEENRARRVLEEAYKLSRGLADPSIRAEAACTLAASLARSEELPRAEALYQAGMQLLPIGPQFTLPRLACLQSGGEIALENGEIQQGIDREEMAQKVLRESSLDSDVLEMHRWTDLAKVYGSAGRDA